MLQFCKDADQSPAGFGRGAGPSQSAVGSLLMLLDQLVGQTAVLIGQDQKLSSADFVLFDPGGFPHLLLQHSVMLRPGKVILHGVNLRHIAR